MCTGHSAACGFIQTWSPSPPQSVSEDAGPHGLSVFATSVGPALYAAPSVLAEILSSSTRLESRTPTYQGEPGLHCSSGPFEGPAVDRMGRAPGHSLQKDGCLGLRQTGLRALVEEGRSARSQPLCLRRQQSLTNLFFKGQGCIGPQLFQPSPLCFSPDRPDPAGNQANQGAEAQSYVSGPTLEEPELVLGAGAAAHCSPMDHSPEMRPPLSGKRNDLAPPARSMGATSLASWWEPSVLPENVLNTISQARAPSTRRLYPLKWYIFSAWCTTPGADPEVGDISLILSFLQEPLEKGRSPSTFKVYVAAIAASHAPIDGQSVGRNNLVVCFLKGSRRFNPSRPVTVPTWDLPTVLRALKSPPFWATTVCWPSSPD